MIWWFILVLNSVTVRPNHFRRHVFSPSWQLPPFYSGPCVRSCSSTKCTNNSLLGPYFYSVIQILPFYSSTVCTAESLCSLQNPCRMQLQNPCVLLLVLLPFEPPPCCLVTSCPHISWKLLQTGIMGEILTQLMTMAKLSLTSIGPLLVFSHVLLGLQSWIIKPLWSSSQAFCIMP